MTNATPGPWETGPEFDHEVVLGGPGIMVADCAIFHMKRTPEENQANARLIAAAPDMRATMKDSVEVLSADDPWDRQHADKMNQAVEKARAIIAKTEAPAAH